MRSSVEVIGEQDHRAALPALERDEQPLLLYPAEDAVSIEAYANHERPVMLIVPDGTWRQAHKMRRRMPGLAAVPCVSLPEAGGRSTGSARSTMSGPATLEAIARALHVLEGDAGVATEGARLELFRIMVARTLWLRGQLGDHEVTSGVPDAAREANPRSTRARRVS